MRTDISACTACVAALLSTACGGARVPDKAARQEVVEVFRGLPQVEGLAVAPQGYPFASTGGGGGAIVRVLNRTASLTFAETSGRPVGMAFDAGGDLYVADRHLRSVFLVKPWAAIRVLAENLTSPEAAAVGPDGNVYVTDSGASRIYRLTAAGERSVFSADVARPRGIVIASGSGRVFVSDGGNSIWRLSPDGKEKVRFASLDDPGKPAGMALDEKGSLYVARDGGGRVTILDPDGRTAGSIAIPGPRVTAVAFGGYEMDCLFVAEAQTGAIYKTRVNARSQRMPWEPGGPLLITWPPDGTIVNRHDGKPEGGGLRIPVRGLSQAGEVRINGAAVAVKDGRFETSVALRERETRLVAEDPAGHRNAVTVLWDSGSFPRYRFSIDDNIWFLRDLARAADKYKSIFDNPYMAFWREMHVKYGAKIHFNIYYETAGFDLSQMPDKYRDEWRRNAGWIRLSFHARANNPARPYLQASADQIRADYRLVTREIERFAGKELLSPVTTLHWTAATLDGARALRKEGVKVLMGASPFRDDLPYGGHPQTVPQLHRILGRDYWKDTAEDIIYIHHDIVINHVPPAQVGPHLDRVAADPHESEVLELLIHEQYFYPDFVAYEADFRERVERAIEWATRRGYKPVFFGDGFLGAGAN